MVDHLPFRVALIERRRREDMGADAELAKHRIEEATPLGVVWLL
jgi:hypothetical protein